MKAIAVTIVIVASLSISLVNCDEDEKTLDAQTRQKRGGWGYEPTYVVSAPAYAHQYVTVPQRTIAVAPSTSYVYPSVHAVHAHAHQPVHSESVVWQSSPNHYYYSHQRHSPRTSYVYYPSNYWGNTHYNYITPTYGW